MVNDMSKWIKHKAGEKCPVPLEWIDEMQLHCGDVLAPDEHYTIEKFDWRCGGSRGITHFKIKEECLVDFQKQKEQASMQDKKEITRIELTSVTVSCGDRSATYDKAVYDENKELIDHWVSGGEVEGSVVSGCWVNIDSLELAIDQLFRGGIDWDFRIKEEKKPAVGEVWEVDCGTDDGDENYRPVVWIYVDGDLRACFFDDTHKGSCNDIAIVGAEWPMRYVCESVKAFYARELWSDHKKPQATTMMGTVRDACKFD